MKYAPSATILQGLMKTITDPAEYTLQQQGVALQWASLKALLEIRDILLKEDDE